MTDQRETGQPPAWVKWLAQDADGTWWGYEAEPHQHDNGWYENECGRYKRLSRAAQNPLWAKTLTKINV